MKNYSKNSSITKRFLTILALTGVLFFPVSCKNKRKVADTSVKATKDSVSTKPAVFDQLLAACGDTLMLSTQALTGWEQLLEAFYNHRSQDYLHESTPAQDAFFIPEAGIKMDDLEEAVRLRHNYCAVMNRVLHGYEWFKRRASDVDDAEDIGTKRDTLRWIRESQPQITDAMLVDWIQNTEALDAARQLLRAYRFFDGNDGEGSPFYEAFRKLNEVYDVLPVIATEEMLDAFEKDFWNWYDKEQFVPGINSIVRMHMQGYEGEKLSEEKIAQLQQAVPFCF